MHSDDGVGDSDGGTKHHELDEPEPGRTRHRTHTRRKQSSPHRIRANRSRHATSGIGVGGVKGNLRIQLRARSPVLNSAHPTPAGEDQDVRPHEHCDNSEHLRFNEVAGSFESDDGQRISNEDRQ